MTELLDYSSLNTDYLKNIVNNYMNDYKKLLDTLSSLDNLSWDSLIQPILDFDQNTLELQKLSMKDFYQDDEIRELCSELQTELSQFAIDQEMRKDYFNKFSYYFNNISKNENLSYEQTKYLEDKNLDYKKMGMYLDDDNYEKVKTIQKELEEVCDNINMNINNENTEFLLELSDLIGLPEKYLEDRKTEDKYKVTLKYPDYLPLMEYCQNRETRKKLYTAFNSRCKDENKDNVKKVFQLRNELAKIFGYDKFSEYELEDKMAKNTKCVMEFLYDIYEKIKPKLHNDLNILRELAQKDNINDLQLYDIAYYSRIHTEKVLSITKEEIKKYFSLERVVNGMFDIYSQLLNFNFVINNDNNHKSWHESVKLYNVYDKNNNLVGYFYLDLFPRQGKYSHAACFDLIKKSKNKPVAIMACNFSKNDNLTFDEVETLFHEFGHVMHHLCAKCTISSLSSFGCEADFVETPSQLFEEWCYVPKTLKMMANEDIPDYVVDKIIESRKILQGYHYARQLLFGLFDMNIHGLKFNEEPEELYNKMLKDIITLDSIDGTNNITSFGHLFGGYGAGYYGYLWSLVYAKDLFSKFKDNELNSDLGNELKDKVLSWGGMRDSLVSMREFLNREPNSDFFIDSL